MTDGPTPLDSACVAPRYLTQPRLTYHWKPSQPKLAS